MGSMMVLTMKELLVLVAEVVYSYFDCYCCMLGHYYNFVLHFHNLHGHQLVVPALDNL